MNEPMDKSAEQVHQREGKKNGLCEREDHANVGRLQRHHDIRTLPHDTETRTISERYPQGKLIRVT